MSRLSCQLSSDSFISMSVVGIVGWKSRFILLTFTQYKDIVFQVSNEVESVMNGDETVLEEAFEKVQEKVIRTSTFVP